MMFRILIFCCSIFFIHSVNGQNADVAIGQWRVHLSYQSVKTVETVGNKIYAASSTGLFYIDETGSITVLSKTDGFSDVGISRLKYNAKNDILVIGYENGNIDLLKGNEIININDILRKAITGSKSINHINFNQNFAYLSTDFGLVILDLLKYEIKETIINLDVQGLSNKIFYSAVTEDNDSIFITTEKGIMVAPLNSSVNLLDYYSWYTYTSSSDIPTNSAQSVSILNKRVYIGVLYDGVYYLDKGKWIKSFPFQVPSSASFVNINNSNNKLIISLPQQVYTIESNGNIKFAYWKGSTPSEGVFDPRGTLWLADLEKGLLNNKESDFAKSYTPNGPLSDKIFNFYYYNNKIFGLGGGYDGNFTELRNYNGFYEYSDNNWTNYNPIFLNSPSISDLVGAVYDPSSDTTYIASHGLGLIAWKSNSGWAGIIPKHTFLEYGPGKKEQFKDGIQGPYSIKGNNNEQFVFIPNSEKLYVGDSLLKPIADYNINYTYSVITFTSKVPITKTTRLKLEFDFSDVYKIYNDTNSPLANYYTVKGSPFVRVTSLALDNASNLYIGNYSRQGFPYLHKKTSKGVWTSFNLDQVYGSPMKIVIDDFNNKWMITKHTGDIYGLTVFNESPTIKQRDFTEATGDGGLPSRQVYSLAKDKKGEIWIGTDKGVAVFYSPSQAFASNVDFGKPIFAGFPLLIDEVITAIKVDGGNRKWIGTRNGIWLFNEDGTEIILNFTTANSPLISNNILAIEINDLTGEVFIGTDLGIVSYRGTATEPDKKFSNVKVFPNPVKPEYNGLVGITGLAGTSLVKITDIYGNLVYETKAQGGMAVWNMKNYNGRKADTGVYLIFAATEDGTQSFVSKIAIID